MKYEITPTMVEFIIQHFEKRIARQKKMMPDPNYRDPWLSLPEQDEKKVKEEAHIAVKKALEFIHNATLVIELMKANGIEE